MAKAVIMRVDAVRLWITRAAPRMHIEASGTVNTGGWTHPELSPVDHGQAPSDGVYEFAFVAEPPQGPATQALSPIAATYTAENPPADLKAIRVIASENSLVAMPEFPE
jgi:hypothetical protein